MVTLSTVLDYMESGKEFSIGYVAADVTRNQYGDIIRIQHCRLLRKPGSKSTKAVSKKLAANNHNSRNPNHGEHFTRNLVLANGEIRKCYIRTIFSFNGIKLV